MAEFVEDVECSVGFEVVSVEECPAVKGGDVFHHVRDEAAGEAIVPTDEERFELVGRAGDDGAEPRVGYLGVTEFASSGFACTTDSLVLEGLAEEVGVVAVVGVPDLGEYVHLGLDHESRAVVECEQVEEGSGGGVPECRMRDSAAAVAAE